MSVRSMLALALVMGALSVGVAQADCKSDLAGARASLASIKEKALQNEHQDPQSAANQIKGYVDSMAAGGCQNELMQFMSFIQSEQQTYPDPQKNPSAYKAK